MSKTHVHQYRRATGRRTRENKDSKMQNYYKCILPDCTHYVRDFMILGKNCICNRCGKVFVLSNSLRLIGNIPHCKECTKKYNRTVKEELDVEENTSSTEVVNR